MDTEEEFRILSFDFFFKISSTDKDRENHLQLLWNISHTVDAGKNDSTGKLRSFELFLLFTLFVPVDRSCSDDKIQISTD